MTAPNPSAGTQRSAVDLYDQLAAVHITIHGHSCALCETRASAPPSLDVSRLRRAVMKRAATSFDLRMSEDDLQAIAAAYSEASAE